MVRQLRTQSAPDWELELGKRGFVVRLLAVIYVTYGSRDLRAFTTLSDKLLSQPNLQSNWPRGRMQRREILDLKDHRRLPFSGDIEFHGSCRGH